MRMSGKFAAALGLVAVLAIEVEPARASSFTYTNIVDPANPTFTQALGINNHGVVAGYGNATNFDGFQVTAPFAAGNFTRENFPNSAPPPATLFTQVTGIDAAGDTVGFYVTNPAVGTTNAFLKVANGAFVPLKAPNPPFNQLLGIDQSGGEVAGYSSVDPTGLTQQQAYTSSALGFADVNALLPANFNSQATGVNNAGTVVGFYQYDNVGDFSAFEDTGGHIAAFQYPGATSTQALGVNDLGEIVGDYVAANGNTLGFLDDAGLFTTLDPFGSLSVTANGINDAGDIVGFYTGNDDVIGFAAAPLGVPEPASLLLFGAGLVGLLWVLRRRRRFDVAA